MATKKNLTVEIKTDSGKKARREARAVVGVVKPSRVVEERQSVQRKPKHKKPVGEEE